MTRLESNKRVIDRTIEMSERKPTGSYEEMMIFQLGVIATVLADISTSLAVIADKIESED